MEATTNGHTDTVRVLLANGADVDIDGISGTALMTACRKGHTEIVRVLLEYDADNYIQNEHVWIALTYASMDNRTETVRVLLEHGVDPNFPCDNGDTSLMWASMEGHTDTVRVLVEHENTDVNIQDDQDRTPLMLASMNGHTDTVRVLLNYDADPFMQDGVGKSALNVAKNPAIKALLESQIRWLRRKSLLMVLSENGFLRSQQYTTSTATAPLTTSSVLSNEELVRQIFSYI